MVKKVKNNSRARGGVLPFHARFREKGSTVTQNKEKGFIVEASSENDWGAGNGVSLSADKPERWLRRRRTHQAPKGTTKENECKKTPTEDAKFC